MTEIILTLKFNSLEELVAYIDGTSPAPAAEAKAALIDAATVMVNPETGEVTTGTRDADPAPTPEITSNTDADGLPYDPEIHATPKSQTAEGLWRSKRGKSKEADAARAAFKAAGGVMTPAVMPTAAPIMPGMPIARAATPEPITMEKLIDKTTGMITRGKVTSDDVVRLYGEIGLTDPGALETNESMRAALYANLAEIEPDLA